MSNWDDKKILTRINQLLVDKLNLVGEYIEGAAKLRCPVDTGNLRDSINYKVNKDELSVRIGTSVEYAPYVELGTKKQKEQSFLRTAMYENETSIKKILSL